MSDNAVPPQDDDSSPALDAFWRQALAASPVPKPDQQRLELARVGIFSAAIAVTPPPAEAAEETSRHGLWSRLRHWWRDNAARGGYHSAWATGLASITLASLVLLMWYQSSPEPEADMSAQSGFTVGSTLGSTQNGHYSAQSQKAHTPELFGYPAPPLAPVPSVESKAGSISVKQMLQELLLDAKDIRWQQANNSSTLAPKRREALRALLLQQLKRASVLDTQVPGLQSPVIDAGKAIALEFISDDRIKLRATLTPVQIVWVRPDQHPDWATEIDSSVYHALLLAAGHK